jgi:hypothetical protein
MNHISQRNDLDTRIKDYVRFMKECPENSVIKLSEEITKMQARVSIIRMMEYQQLRESVTIYFEVKQSKLNFKTI